LLYDAGAPWLSLLLLLLLSEQHVIDLTWQYPKHSRVDKFQISIYEHNFTRFTPVVEQMGAPIVARLIPER